MSDVAIRVEGLGKQYRIGAKQAPYQSLRETIMNVAKAPARRLKRMWSGEAPSVLNNTIWALKDVTFEIEQGEVIGVIGRNGAGKTTLLKVLSRITKPTEGSVDLNGRVGSLLEVGTGFHPELTGRENIYLNGAILGMKRREIDRKFDEIVAFAEIEKFLDTTVKHYSSGMHVRLAFAVAAHLEPEILLVDEVLAVGDAAFQKKCMGKMGKVAEQGRTVLFVSHNMAAIQQLCSRAMLFESGRLFQDGRVSGVISEYLNLDQYVDEQTSSDRLIRWRESIGANRLSFFRIDTPDQLGVSTVQSGSDLDLVIGCESPEANHSMIVSWVLVNPLGHRLILFHNRLENTDLRTADGVTEIVCHVSRLPLTSGSYRFNLQLFVDDELVDEASTDWFTVASGDFFGSGAVVNPQDALFLMKARWSQRDATVINQLPEESHSDHANN